MVPLAAAAVKTVFQTKEYFVGQTVPFEQWNHNDGTEQNEKLENPIFSWMLVIYWIFYWNVVIRVVYVLCVRYKYSVSYHAATIFNLKMIMCIILKRKEIKLSMEWNVEMMNALDCS